MTEQKFVPRVVFQHKEIRAVQCKSDRVVIEELSSYDAMGNALWNQRESYYPVGDRSNIESKDRVRELILQAFLKLAETRI